MQILLARTNFYKTEAWG